MIAVVTGASSGIGRASAEALARDGATVVLAARRADPLREIAAHIQAAGGRALPIVTDVAREPDVRELFRRTEAELGRVDVLVYAAGRGLPKPLAEIGTDEWHETIAANYTGAFYCLREAVASMRRTRTRGSLIVISSMAGLVNVPGYAAYCSSKHAVTSLCRCLRGEVRRDGIRVATLHPYKIATEFFDSYERKPDPARMLTAEEIATLVVAIARRRSARAASLRIRNLALRAYRASGLARARRPG